MVAAIAYIPDVSSNPEFADYWNKASKAERKRIIVSAGFTSKNYQYRAWAAIPSGVRADLVTIMKRNQATATAAAKPRSIPNPNHWYNKD